MKQFDFFTDSVIEEIEEKETIQPQTHKETTININEEIRQYWASWKPKEKKLLGGKDHTDKLKHGWLMPYLGRIDSFTNKRWEYWAKVQQLSPIAYYELVTKGLTEKFVAEAIHCHDYPKLSFSEDKKTFDYLHSVIDLICGDGSINGIDAFEFLLDWLLFGFGHENFTELPASPSRDKQMNNKLYEYFDLSPLLMNPYDYFGLMLPQLFSQDRNQKVGFFPTPMNVCIAMTEMIAGQDKPTIQRFQESCAGTGSIVLAWSNKGLNASISELSNTCTKACLVNCYFYAPQFARPLFYLAEKSTFVCGNALSEEVFHDYHAKYKKNIADNLAKEFAH